MHIEKYIAYELVLKPPIELVFFMANNVRRYVFQLIWLSPRPISTGHLNTSLHLQLQPIKHMCLYVVLLD